MTMVDDTDAGPVVMAAFHQLLPGVNGGGGGDGVGPCVA
jgi:hypothetical protein